MVYHHFRSSRGSRKSRRSGAKKRLSGSEYIEQIKLKEYIDSNFPGVPWSASAGGMRTSMQTAIKMKQMGYKRGCPDILIFVAKKGFNGLMIELKRPERGEFGEKVGRGVLSDSQKKFLEILRFRGYMACVCHGFEMAKLVVDYYLGGDS